MKHIFLRIWFFNRPFILMICLVSLFGCKKDWLDVKSSARLAVPSTLVDLQAIMDNSGIINGQIGEGQMMISEIGEISADNFFVSDASYQSLSGSTEYRWQSNAYRFASDIYEGVRTSNMPQMWNRAYQRIYYANVTLEGLIKIKINSENADQYNNVKGIALFTRSYFFSRLLDIYSKPYDKATASGDLGIPIRLSSDLNTPSFRENVKNCYDRIISDLKEAISLLPNTTAYKTRPSKATAYALLARIYLSIGEFENAERNAEECLKLNNKLMDFSSLSASSAFPFTRNNEEILYQDIRTGPVFFNEAFSRVDPLLLSSYEVNDLRRTLFFKSQSDGNYSFKGSYDGSSAIFYGIATDEVYLTFAECLARTGKTENAMKYLNDLLRMRWAKSPDGSTKYIDAVATNSSNALKNILAERRKELAFRGIRWMDLRRLNRESEFQTTITRMINGTTYELLPNSSKYVFPIPDDIIQITSMPQNQR